nr:hypothetical protein [Desulfobulbaceae bacterium]
KGTNCIALNIGTRQLTADSSSFSGRIKITLGQELFDLEQKLLQNIQTDSESLPKNLREIAELGEIATFNFRQLKISITNIFDLNTAECREQLEAIQEGLQETIKNSNRPLNPKLTNRCYSLQNLVSAQPAAIYRQRQSGQPEV